MNVWVVISLAELVVKQRKIKPVKIITISNNEYLKWISMPLDRDEVSDLLLLGKE